ncbi:helix-turn-helix transcriptional regulator [Paracoccus sp. T5]|uniref:helix-turn-helix transcriptional regulator n=1 Tax=Paracoccus sp. T5 TaxID=3402161 RepID=UPI003AE4C9C2
MQARDVTQQTHALIDHIYAAIFGETSWQVFMEESRALLPNGQTVLVRHDQGSGTGAFALAGGLDQETVRRYNREYYALNPWTDHALARPLRQVMQADEMLPRDQLLRTQFYHEYLRPQDVVTGLGVTLSRDRERHFFFSIVGADADAAHINNAKRAIAALVPHLSRAFEPRRVPSPVGGPSSGTLRVDGRLKIVAADPDALEMIEATEALSVNALGRLCCRDTDLLDLLRQMLDAEASAGPAVRYRHLKRRDGGLPLRACIYRPGHSGGEIFGGMDCVIRLTDPARSLEDAAQAFCRMHRLSGAEACIVAALVGGLSIDQIAASRHTSTDTVRTQLKNIYLKSGCHRQSDIMRHVAVMTSPGEPI